MKKLIEKLKKMSPFSVAGILIFLGIIILFFLKRCNENNDLPITNYVANKIDNYKDELGENRAKIENTGAKENNGGNSVFLASEVKRLSDALDIKENQILAITEFNGTLSDSLKLVKLERDAANNKVWKWEKELKSRG